ncbi:AAA family ATPase [Archangium violaceum]|uniref:AAA family ATPase n=1 Tax=Archangium violaceum TaxID=83451 RepID=UPI001EF13056|nr:AAA family ATPase [Archangium violaceum]
MRVESVHPPASETWATFERLSANERVLAYVRERGLYSDATETEARATPGQSPRLALALRSLSGKVCDVQFRAVEEVPHDKRFMRLGNVPDSVGPLVFGQLGTVEELVLIEGMSDFLAALGPFALPYGSVLGLPGATCAQKMVEALVECMPRSLRTVVLAFDNDLAGNKAAEDVIPLLTNAGLSVKRVCPPPPHKDLADWAVALLRTGEDAPTAWRDALATAPRSRSWLVPATDFVAEAPSEVRFLIKDVLPVGALALVQGSPGVGKTWLTLHYASLVTKQDKRVILVEQEGSPAALSKRLRLIGVVHPLLSIAHGQPIRLDDPAWVEQLARACQQQEAALLILDPLADLHSGDENDTQDMTRLTAALKHIRRAAPDCTILLLHHTVKGAWSAVTARREHSRGSSVLVGAADVQISLTQLDPGRTKPAAHFLLELVKARDFQAPPPMKFTLLVQEGRGEVVVQPVEADAEGTEREETEEELDTRALSKIPTDASGDTISLEELRQRLHVGKEKAQGTVQRLIAAGHVMRVPNRGLRRTGKTMSAQEGDQP